MVASRVVLSSKDLVSEYKYSASTTAHRRPSNFKLQTIHSSMIGVTELVDIIAAPQTFFYRMTVVINPDYTGSLKYT
jgi:hypothetical protein